MKLHFKKFIVIFILFLLFILISSYSYANSISKELSSNIFRLHIIANSDSKEDQELKLKIRDNIISYLNTKTKECATKKEVTKIISDNIYELQKIAIKTIKENGYDYNVTLEIGNFYFPTKYYGNISMPSGNYDALKIKVGDGNGQNWWCSLFPALCFTEVPNGIVDKKTENILKNNLNLEEFELLTSKSTTTKIKFKLIELFN